MAVGSRRRAGGRRRVTRGGVTSRKAKMKAGRLPREQAPRAAQREGATHAQRLGAAREVREDVRDEGDDLLGRRRGC